MSQRHASEPPSDEAFWREQEKRHRSLEQPCCTQSNMCWTMMDMPGDIAVVVHGEGDCLNSFFHHQGRNTASYYSTRLSAHQISMGDTQEPLRQLLRLIARARRPEAIAVLGTCPLEIIGATFESLVQEVAGETGIPMLALRTHGLALMNQTRCQDWLYSELAALPQVAGSADEALNVIGLPHAASHPELEGLLQQLGLRLNDCYPNSTSLSAWRRIANASASFVVDRETYPQLAQRLQDSGQDVRNVPAPIGLEQTAIFYREIADAFGVSKAMEEALTPLRCAQRERFEQTAARARGCRLAMCIRMFKTHFSDRLAFDGLADLPMLRDLGFEVVIYVQGPPESAARDRFAERLRMLGYGDVSFDVFQGPWMLGERLEEGGFAVAVMSDAARNVVEEAGIQMIPGGAFEPFFSGMDTNLRIVDRVMDALS